MDSTQYKEGYTAFLAGKGFYDNVYSRLYSPDKARAWWDGWEKARADDEAMHGPK